MVPNEKRDYKMIFIMALVLIIFTYFYIKMLIYLFADHWVS